MFLSRLDGHSLEGNERTTEKANNLVDGVFPRSRFLLCPCPPHTEILKTDMGEYSGYTWRQIYSGYTYEQRRTINLSSE